MSNNKQSSVEWLFEQVCNLDWKNIQGEKKLEILEQGKAMHKEEIKTCMSIAFIDGLRIEDVNYKSPNKDWEDYYTKAFGY